MTSFELTVVGAAEAIISARDCPHMTTYPTATPCRRCVEQEQLRTEAMVRLVLDEGDRRCIAMRREGAVVS